ncbi:long-chain fatty-acid-CoA ligase [Neobacillus bataviensis LMG 21833]|uniref:Long-chain fatty-acid-CoA ligase n=1 Tax=Neobacillus bataviensis LMG 21833 TaxID=1117379 RepID=K6DRK3_9BACI|nr:AMP-binding protein [Neobacillus bataviensis]EKN70964.1 long-chain fatty-acid-CoA ligase [Neobacillus bataviensis LMG 21833]
MKDLLQKSWPKEVDKTLTYRLGERPLHEYVMQNAIDTPQKKAYSFYGRDVSWQELNESIGRFAQFLASKGVEKGDRIALFMQNCPQYIIAHYGIQRLGGIVVPLNPMYKESELEYLINEASVKAVVAGEELQALIGAVRPKTASVEFVVTTNYADYLPENTTLPIPDELSLKKQHTEHTFDFIQVLHDHEPYANQVKIDLWNDIGLMVFTSGTTGRPKAAMLPYGSALFKTAATIHANQFDLEGRYLTVAPLCHIAGMVMGVNIPVYSGAECNILTRFDPTAIVEAIEKYQITNWYSIAPMNVAILNLPGIENRDLSSLKRNSSTSFGIPVTEQLANQWKELTKGCIMHEASYGLSETHTCDTFMPLNRIKWGSCGIPTFNTELKIVDFETGKPVGPGEKGEIVLKNPGVFKGYLDRPDATAETLRDGWVHTGDIGSLDEDGYLYFHGRIKEMIKSSGYSVFPEDVEALLNEHPGIQQSAVIGVPDPIRGESVKAFIVLKPEYAGKISENEMIRWANEKMAAYKYPRFVEFLDALPATSSGKVLRRLLKEPQAKDVKK